MGLTWSKVRSVKDGTLLVTNASFPAEKAKCDELWNVWKEYKDKIKKDGFSPQKYKDVWQVAYFHNVNSDTYEKSEEGEHLWKLEFQRKCKKWGDVIAKRREASAQIEEELIDGINNLNTDD